MFSLNGMPLISFMLVTLLELPIQSDHHLLGKGTPCWNQQSSTTKIRQNGHLRRFWIYNIQNQIIIFNTRFTDLIAILILSNITQIVISFRTHLKLYMNITHNTSINQICSLLNWNWFIISQQRQAKKKSEMWSQRSFQAHYSSLTESNFEKMISELWKWSLCSKWRIMLRMISCWNNVCFIETI